MNRFVFIRLFFIPVACFFVTASSAQTAKSGYEWGAGFGFIVYQGDLTPKKLGSFETQRPAVMIQASRLLTGAFSVRAQFMAGKLKGDDALYEEPAYRQQRNFNFTSPVFEFSGQLLWNITGTNYSDNKFSPYLFAGAGISFLKIKRDWSQVNRDFFPMEDVVFWSGLSADSARKLPRILPVIPAGAGIKFFFKPNWAIQAELVYRVLPTDYLDGFSQSADPDHRDNYFHYSIGIVYRRHHIDRLKCPEIKY